MFDRLEVARTDNGKERVVWDMLAWYGGDRKRLYFKSEGENQLDDGEPSELESAEWLGSYLVALFWELQAGVGVAGSTASGADVVMRGREFSVIPLVRLTVVLTHKSDRQERTNATQ